MSKVLFGAAVALLMLTAAQASSDDKVVEKPLVAQTLDGFNREAVSIRESMKPGGRYEFLKADDVRQVEAGLTTMESLLQKNAGQNDLSPRDKVALVNAQEQVNAVLKHNDSNRLVCERKAPIGSHIPVTSCRTYGEIEQQRREAQKGVNDMAQKWRASNPNGSGN